MHLMNNVMKEANKLKLIKKLIKNNIIIINKQIIKKNKLKNILEKLNYCIKKNN